MAKKHENLDQVFRDKLENHQVKPSQLAWERLESQLPSKEKSSTKLYWWAAAAVILVLISVGSLFYNSESPISEENLVAENTAPVENPVEELPELEMKDSEKTVSEANSSQASEKTENQKQNIPSSTQKNNQPKVSKPEKTPTQNLIAEAETSPQILEVIEEKKAVEPLIVEKEFPKLKPLDINQAIAQAESPSMEEEPAYKVTIFSDGIKEDKNLITGIGKKVNQVEGLLGKVDEGFASLQDAKNNLFANLTTKKEKVAEE